MTKSRPQAGDQAAAQEKGQNWVGIALGGLVSVGVLAVLFVLVDFQQVKSAFAQIDLRYLPVVVALFFVTLLARTVAWRTILQEKITFKRTFLTLNQGYLFNNLLPFRLGEVARAFLLNRTDGISFWEVLSTIMVERIFDISLLAVLLLTTVPFVVGVESAERVGYIAAVVVVVGFAVLFWVARNQDTVLRWFERLTKPWPRLTEFGREKLVSLLNGLGALRDAGRFIKVLFWMVVTWLSNIAWYTVLLAAFVPGIRLLASAFAVGFVAMGVSIPSSPGYIGVFEAAEVYALTRFDIPEATAFAYAVVAHSLYLLITIVIGALALARDGQSLGEVYRGLRRLD